MLDAVARLILAVSFPVVLLFSVLQAVVFQPSYYNLQFERYEIEEATGMEKEHLMYTMGEVLDYLRGERKDLIVDATVKGQEREIFGDREKRHMEDVRELFLLSFAIRNTAAVLLVLSLAFLILNGSGYFSVCRALWRGAVVTLALAGLVAGSVATNFTYFFDLFHEVLFDNYYWQLDPEREILIQMLPEGFFMDTFYLSIAIFAAIMMLVAGSSFFCLKNKGGYEQ